LTRRDERIEVRAVRRAVALEERAAVRRAVFRPNSGPRAGARSRTHRSTHGGWEVDTSVRSFPTPVHGPDVVGVCSGRHQARLPSTKHHRQRAPLADRAVRQSAPPLSIVPDFRAIDSFAPRAAQNGAPYVVDAGPARRRVIASSEARSSAWKAAGGGIFDVEGLRHEIDRLNDRTLAPGASGTMRRRAPASRTKKRPAIEGHGPPPSRRARRLAKDLRELLDMAEGDESIIDEIAGSDRAAGGRGVRQMEGRAHARRQGKIAGDAILAIHAGHGAGLDAEDWTTISCSALYLRWAEKEGLQDRDRRFRTDGGWRA